jgi:hypothetical protein
MCDRIEDGASDNNVGIKNLQDSEIYTLYKVVEHRQHNILLYNKGKQKNIYL